MSSSDVLTGVRAGAPGMNVISTCRYTRLMPHPCLHRSVVSLQFAPYLSSLSSHSGFGDHPKLLRLQVKEPSLTGLEHSGLLTCGLKGHSCCDTLTPCVCSLPHWWPHRRSHHCKYRHPFDVTRLLCGHAVLCSASAAVPLLFKRKPGSNFVPTR